ncbi:MAG: DUF5989 family protein [Candidatus Liptonbacteria bacterium]|nr:DUF5989 family protein [Candidatus Liptonbacteria bacterium]
MNKLSVLKEFWDFLRASKKWWIIVAAFILLLLGGLLFLSQGSAVAPFIYTIF